MDELQELITEIMSLTRVQWGDNEIQDLENFMISLFELRAQIVALDPDRARTRSSDPKCSFAKGMIIPFETAELMVKTMGDFGLSEDVDYEVLPAGYQFICTSTGGGALTRGSETTLLARENYEARSAKGYSIQVRPFKEWFHITATTNQELGLYEGYLYQNPSVEIGMESLANRFIYFFDDSDNFEKSPALACDNYGLQFEHPFVTTDGPNYGAAAFIAETIPDTLPLDLNCYYAGPLTANFKATVLNPVLPTLHTINLTYDGEQQPVPLTLNSCSVVAVKILRDVQC